MAGLEQYLNNPNVRKMLDLISYTEHTQGNGYYTAFGGGRLSSLADHPRYSKPFRQTDGRMNTTSAAGKYQFLKSTWDGLARRYGFSDFSPQNQDLGAVALLIQRGAMPHLLKGDFANAIAKSGAEWASLPTSPHPQPTKSWKQVNAFLGGKIQVPQSGGQVAPQGIGSFNVADLMKQSAQKPQPLGKFNVADLMKQTPQAPQPLGQFKVSDLQAQPPVQSQQGIGKFNVADLMKGGG